MGLDEIAARDMEKIASRHKLVIALRFAESQYSFAQLELARALAGEREEAFRKVRELEQAVEKARKALAEYDQAARSRGWPA